MNAAPASLFRRALTAYIAHSIPHVRTLSLLPVILFNAHHHSRHWTYRYVTRLLLMGYLLAITLTVLGCAGLLLPPRPLFTWFPSLTVLSTSVFAISALLSLDKGIRLRSRSSLSVYIVSRFAIILMMCISMCLLMVGFHSGHTTLQITIPLFLLCIVHAMCGCFAIVECISVRRVLPMKRDCCTLLTAEKCEQIEQLNVVSCGLDRFQTEHKYLSGSVQTVLTTASDL